MKSNLQSLVLVLLFVGLLLLLLFPNRKPSDTPSLTEQVGAIFDVTAGPLSGCRDHTAIYNSEPYLKNVVYAKH